MISVNCDICGKEFKIAPSRYKRFKRRYCSMECLAIGYRQPEVWLTSYCGNCGAEVSYRRRGRIRQFCSKKCAGEARRDPNAKWRNPEYIKQYMENYVKRNRAELSRKSRLRDKRDLEMYHARQMRYRENHRDEIMLANHERYNHKRIGKITPDEWEDIKARYNYKCACCHNVLPLELDHIVPLSKGGLHIKENIQPLCRSCNASKGDEVLVY